uniref:RING-type domain-containing protein n=1 Tax=Accipiter nisus TaxID=211598 RepID=A0A8B9MUX8_9AVES
MAEDTEGVPSLDCVICFAPYDRLFKVPKVLGCGHTFCLECLARVTVVAPAAPTLLCPICRCPTALPRCRGPPALPTRADLLALLPPGPTGSVRFIRILLGGGCSPGWRLCPGASFLILIPRAASPLPLPESGHLDPVVAGWIFWAVNHQFWFSRGRGTGIPVARIPVFLIYGGLGGD